MTRSLGTTTAMFVFNRPDTTARVLDAVRAARPRQLLVVADGPRPGRPDEARRCEEVRALFSRIDWDCEVEREFSPVNLGCRRRVSSGLDWVFERADEAIILEDDCLPHPTFFPYCEALLDRHREDPRIMAITGDNFQRGRCRGSGSYYFSRSMHVWGWASWRRAWRHYDATLADWPQRRTTDWLQRIVHDRGAARTWTEFLDRAWAGEIDTWDFQWAYAIWAHGGLVATPNVNLVSNIGATGTHTRGGGSRNLDLPTAAIDLPPIAPVRVEADEEADEFVFRTLYRRPLRVRVAAFLQSLLRR